MAKGMKLLLPQKSITKVLFINKSRTTYYEIFRHYHVLLKKSDGHPYPDSRRLFSYCICIVYYRGILPCFLGGLLWLLF